MAIWVARKLKKITKIRAQRMAPMKNPRRRGRRVPERTLLLLDFLGGSLGGILGMLLFRHKTLHLKFRVLPVVFLGAQAGVLFWLYLAPPW